jgi:hypothetical protein
MVLVVVQQCEYTLKMVKMVNFMLRIFYHNKNCAKKSKKVRMDEQKAEYYSSKMP